MNRLQAVCWAALLLAMLSLAACDDQGVPTDGDDDFPNLTPYYAADYLTNYVEVLGCTNSTPHGLRMRIHINSAANAAAYQDRPARENSSLPVGTIIVKTEYQSSDCSGVPIRITAIRKGVAGTAPATGDWEWQEIDFLGQDEQEGAGLTDCLVCHADSGLDDCGPEWDYTCIREP